MAFKLNCIISGLLWIVLSYLCKAVAIDIQIKLENGISAPSTVSAVENTELVLYCHHSDNVRLVWRKIGDETFEVYNANLSFTIIQLLHAGTYLCEDDVNNLNQTVTVRVLYSPSLPTVSGPNIVMMRKTFSLTCSADSNPDPSFYWTYQPDENSQVAFRGRTYNDTLQSEDFQVYCWAVNSMFPTIGIPVRSAQKQMAVIKGLEAVYIWELHDEYTFNVSTILVIYCRTTANPSPKTWWTRDDDPTFMFEGDRLYIPNVNIDFSGYYSCNVENVLQPSGQPQRIATDVKHTLIKIVDPGIPEECRGTCQRLVNKAVESCSCTQNVDHTGCSNGLIAATAIGWIIAAVILIAFLFCCIKHRDSHLTGKDSKGASKQEDDRIEMPTADTARQIEEERLATRPVLPVRPDVAHRSNEHNYSYIAGGEDRREQGRFNTVSGKYDYIVPVSGDQNDYLELGPNPVSAEYEYTPEQDIGVRISEISIPTNKYVKMSIEKDSANLNNEVDDDGYLKSIRHNNDDAIQL